MVMNVEFTGYALSDGRFITSNCILQNEKACQDRVFLMEDHKMNWTEVDPATVKQTMYDDRDRGNKE